MNSATFTVISGVVLLVVIALVRWNVQQRENGRSRSGSGEEKE